MFKRTLQVDVVKEKKSKPIAEIDQPETSFEDKAKIVGKVVEQGIRKISRGVATYIILDTVRKVVVAAVKN